VEPTVCVVGLNRADELFRRYDADLDTPPARFDQFVTGGFIRYMEPAQHDRVSRKLRHAVSPALIAGAAPTIGLAVQSELAGIAAAGPATAREVGDRVVRSTFLQLFFGVAPGTQLAAALGALYENLDPRRAWRVRPSAIRRSVVEIARLVEGLDLDGTFLGIMRRQTEDADRDVTTANLVYLAGVSAADVAGLLAWILRMLADHPAVFEQLRAHPEPPRFARAIIAETLRLEQSEFIVRRARRDLEIDGFRIPAGWRVRVCVRESHRDPERFPDPERFMPARFLEAAPRRGDYSPFGQAATRTTCLGENLTYAVATAMLLALANNHTLRVIDDGPREFSGFHWRPAARLRLAL